MIELLILYELRNKVLTMYGISREINKKFSVLTTPSFGTIKPALKRLEKDNCIKYQKTMSSGGRPSTYYSITDNGKNALKELLLEQPLNNPIHFLPSARVKAICSSILEPKEQIELFKNLKQKAESIVVDIKNIIENNELDFYSKIVFDNLICEYKNFISLLEGLAHASKN